MSTEIVSLLIAERDRIQAAIDLLQGPTKKRGRPKGSKNTPPAWVTGKASAPPLEVPAKKKRNYSPAQRKAAALRMKKMWRERKKADRVKSEAKG